MTRPRAIALALLTLAVVMTAPTAAHADESVCVASTFYSEVGTGGFYHPIDDPTLVAPLEATGYDCAVTSEEIPERQKRFYTLVYATTTWDDFRDIIANFEADGWRLDASAITIDRGDGEVFEDPGDLSDEPAPLLFSTRALGDEGTVAFRFVDDEHALDPSFSGQQLEIRVFLAAEVATSGTALDDPSVLSDLKTLQQAAPTPTQAAVIGVSSVLLTLLIGYPGFLLSRVLANRYEQLFAWTRRLPKLPVKQPGWALWLGIATAAVVASFIDPRFGANPMSARILLTVFAAFVVYNVLGWMAVKAIVRRIEPTAEPVVQFRWGSILLLVVAVIASRVLQFSPGIVFGIVAGLTFATSLVLARRALVVLVGSAFAVTAGLLAWVLYSVLTLAPDNFATVTLSELFSAVAIEGIATLPLALLPFAAFGGGVLSQWKTWVWALAYGCGVAVFLLVLVTAPASVGQIPGDFLRWVLIFVAFALVSVVAWLIDRRASRVPLTHG